MDDSPQKIVERLTKYVDELLMARERNNELAEKGRIQMIRRALEKLDTVHAKSPLPIDLVSRIEAEKMRSQLKLPATSSDYQNICWDCWAHGKKVIVDKRVDAVCSTCNWVRCPECGACRDPRFGGCSDRISRTSRPHIPQESNLKAHQ